MSDLMMFGAGPRRPVRERPPMDLRSTSHAVTCDYLLGRRFRVCTCQASRSALFR